MVGLMGRGLEICSWVPRQKGRHRELAVEVGNVGQVPKVEELAQGEGASYGEELTREPNAAVWGSAACSSDKAGGSGHCRA